MAKKPVGGAFHFKIQNFTPETLPMARLAEYLADLATMLGHEESVHFVKVAEGSADLVHYAEPEQERDVLQRIHLLKIGDAPQDAQKAFRAINQKLREDGTSANMVRGRGKILFFEGVKAETPASYGPLTQPGSLQGRLIKIGGKDETKPVHIQSKDAYYICNANAEVAKRLAKAYEEEIRVFGVGKWSRTTAGEWCLDHFNITDFEPLDTQTIGQIVGELREIPENGWLDVADPLATLTSIRDGGKVN